MNPNDPLLISELKRDEGVEYTPYFDSVGIETVGVGHNLKVSPLDVHYPLTDDQVDLILSSDLVKVFSSLDAHLGWWRNLSYARQRVLANMCFNLGIGTLLTFKNTLGAIEQGQYEAAAQGMLNSKWAHQVGKRANRLAQLMVEG